MKSVLFSTQSNDAVRPCIYSRPDISIMAGKISDLKQNIEGFLISSKFLIQI